MQDTDPTQQPRLPIGVPELYADGLIDCIYGFYTTKLVFGVEQGGDMPPRPKAILTIPTMSLYNAALQIVKELSSPQLVAQTDERYTQVLNMLRTAAAHSAQLTMSGQTPEGAPPVGTSD